MTVAFAAVSERLSIGTSGVIYACDVATGRSRTRVSDLPPTGMTVDGDRLYVTGFATLAAFDTDDDSRLWTVDRLNKVTASRVILRNGTLFVGTEFNVTAVGVQSGSVEWRASFDSAVERVLPGPRGSVWAATSGGSVAALAPETDERRAQLTVDGRSDIAFVDDVLVVAGDDLAAYRVA